MKRIDNRLLSCCDQGGACQLNRSRAPAIDKIKAGWPAGEVLLSLTWLIVGDILPRNAKWCITSDAIHHFANAKWQLAGSVVCATLCRYRPKWRNGIIEA